MPKPPLLFLHGVTRCGASVAPLEAALRTRYEVRAPDFPGHGSAPRRQGRYRVIDHAEAAEEWLTEQPAVVYGHSMGAMVAAVLAAKFPHRVEALVLEDPPFHTMGARIRQTPLYNYFRGVQGLAGDLRPIHELVRQLAAVRYGPPGDESALRLGDQRDPAALRFTARCLRQLDPQVLTPVIEGEWLEEYDFPGIFSRVRCPILLLQADPGCGGMLIDQDADAIARLAADCTRVRIPNAGHLLHWLATEGTLRPVLSFLASMEPGKEHR